MNLREVIGGRCSVISKTGVRYVGTLISIESEQKTLSFEKVLSYGTEGRIGNGRDIPPSNNIFDYIIFKADEITALKLVEPAAPEYGQNPVFNDPAIVGSGTRPAPPPQERPAPPPMTTTPFGGGYPQSLPPPSQNPFPQPSSVASYQTQPNNQTHPGMNSDFGDSYQHNNQKKNNFQNRNPPRSNPRTENGQQRGRQGLTLPQEAFDFESFNAQFNKDDVMKEFSNESEQQDGSGSALLKDAKGYYDKKTSFFDNISCDAKSKAEGQPRDRAAPGQIRKSNFETFGENVHSNGYNRYHVNHRNGQRNNYRGRGRGNYNNRSGGFPQGQNEHGDRYNNSPSGPSV